MTVVHSGTEGSLPEQADVAAVLSTSAMSAIHARGLSMVFGRERALDALDLDLPSGAIYALIGPNGAGKSTLIKILMNILRPSSGTAAVLGMPSARVAGEAFARIGYVSENQEMPEWMTVTELLGYLRPFYPQWDRALEEQLAAQFDLPLRRKLKHLSRGQRMKAALLSVLPYRPSLIVLDEPFSGLDPLVRDELVECLLDRVAQEANAPTILISSHDLAEVETLASHVGYLDRGRLLFSEESARLTARFREVTVTLPAPAAEIKQTFPASWMLVETSGPVVRFVHAQADTEPVKRQVAAQFPGAAHVQMGAMSLRAIFLALAKSTRHGARESRRVA